MKDTLFQNPELEKHPFAFTAPVAQVFDDMLNRSIPHYQDLQEMIAQLAASVATPNCSICDLGCSTGTTIQAMAQNIAHPIRFLGVDYSAPMLQKAQEKCRHIQPNIQWQQHDLNTLPQLPTSRVIILNLVLQFIKPENRQPLLQALYDTLEKNGMIIIVEKVTQSTAELQAQYRQFYHRFKAQNGYTQQEIKAKESALKDVLVSTSIQGLHTLLHQAKFTHIEPFYQWFNFYGVLAIK